VKGEVDINIILTGVWGFCAFLILFGYFTNNPIMIGGGFFLGFIVGLAFAFSMMKE